MKKIKKRADQIISIGAIEEKDLYNIGIRMAEGNLTQEETIILLEESTDESFANKIKDYSEEQEQEKLKLLDNIEDRDKIISTKEEQIESLLKQQNQNISNIKDLKNRLYIIEKEKFVSGGLRKRKQYTIGYLVFASIIIILWFINRVYSNIIDESIALIISFIGFAMPTFGLRFIDHTTIKEFFNRKKLKQRLENDFDKNNSL